MFCTPGDIISLHQHIPGQSSYINCSQQIHQTPFKNRSILWDAELEETLQTFRNSV